MTTQSITNFVSEVIMGWQPFRMVIMWQYAVIEARDVIIDVNNRRAVDTFL